MHCRMRMEIIAPAAPPRVISFRDCHKISASLEARLFTPAGLADACCTKLAVKATSKPLPFICNVSWIDPSYLTAQKLFKKLRLLEVPEVILGQPLLDGLPAICIELLANIAAAKGRKASVTDEIQNVRLRRTRGSAKAAPIIPALARPNPKKMKLTASLTKCSRTM